MSPPGGKEGGRRRRRAAGAMADGNADWMGSLPAALCSYPLSNLAIPGETGGEGDRRLAAVFGASAARGPPPRSYVPVEPWPEAEAWVMGSLGRWWG